MINSSILKKLIAFAIIIITFTTSCKRTEIPTTPDPTPTNPVYGPVNDAAQVMASVSGIVLDESNIPIANAVVTSGAATTTTNSNGMFIFQSISLSKENGSITAVKAGYFKGIRSFKTTEGKNHSVRLQLMQRVLSGSVNSATGGTINSNGGATIIFPVNAFVTSTGAVYTGTVNVYSRWIDPTAANLPFVIPGDLRGVNITGVESILETYGMVGAELADASGNILKIAPGKTATVSFPIPASISATAPASIVLWHFDDATARWKENGTATKTGSTYIAQVDKFSFWNVDMPYLNFITLNYTLVNGSSNIPFVSTITRIRRVSDGAFGYGVTNNVGFVSGLVPKNEALILEVISNCNTVVYSQNIGSFATNTSLANINITVPTSFLINFTGILLNCNGTPVSNGYVSLATNTGIGAFAVTNSNGSFSFSTINCSSVNLNYYLQGVDNSTGQKSTISIGSVVNGNVNLGNINACSATLTEEIYVAGTERAAKLWKNGIVTNLSNVIDTSFAYSVFVLNNDVYVAGSERNNAKFWKNGIGANLTTNSQFSNANSIYVTGNDIYVAGNEGFIAKLWINGVATNLNNTVSFNAGIANSVFVQGNDVYVVGYEYNALTANIHKAKLWTNGVATNLVSSTVANSFAYSVAVTGSDVYVAGSFRDSIFNNPATKSKATIWKNGVPIYLTNGNNNGYAYSIYIVGNDVFVAGYETVGTINTAKVWKNGVELYSFNGYIAKSIFVKGNDIYVTGQSVNGGTNTNSVVWKNGLATNYFNATNTISPSSIFVK
jgi:hypothetical protein